MRPRTPGQPCARLSTAAIVDVSCSTTEHRPRYSTVPLAYRIDEQKKLVTITGDYAEPAEWRALLARVRSDPRLRPGFGFMRDLRYSTPPVDAQAVMGIIAVVRQMWAALGVRRAAMVTRPGIDVPAAVAHALAEDENLPLRAFTSYDDAVGWLAEE